MVKVSKLLYIQNQINMEGIIKSVEKKMNNGTHENFPSHGDTLFCYNVVITTSSGEVSGKANAKSNTGTPYGPGDSVIFDMSTNSHGNQLKIKKAENQQGGSRANNNSYGANMEHVTRQNAINLSLELMEGFADKVDSTMLTSLITHFHGYINKSNDRAEQYARIAALHFVIKAKKPETNCINTNNWKSTEEIIKAAEKFEAYIISGTVLPTSFMQFHV